MSHKKISEVSISWVEIIRIIIAILSGILGGAGSAALF